MSSESINLRKYIAIVGTKGLPAKYGGFETFVENFCAYNVDFDVRVYCDSDTEGDVNIEYTSTHKLPLNANGTQGIIYDIYSMLLAVRERRTILLLGCSGAIIIPLIRAFGGKVITNIAGIEWSRAKWGLAARTFLKISERIAIRFSNVVIADNEHIQSYIKKYYQADSQLIPYGGDHVKQVGFKPIEQTNRKCFVALARCQPDNNIEMILDAFINSNETIEFMSNWSVSKYGDYIKKKYKNYSNILLIEASYDLNTTVKFRLGAKAYIHGHSAGGTNPALVEAMVLGKICICFDNGFNNATTNHHALFFSNSNQLKKIVDNFDSNDNEYAQIATKSEIFANEHYRWQKVCMQYTEVLINV